jgi:hypothetical protein
MNLILEDHRAAKCKNKSTSKWLNMAQNGQNYQNSKDGTRWPKIDQNVRKWPKWNKIV